MVDSILYQMIPVEEKEACLMCLEEADVVYIPTSTPLCLACKIKNDDAIHRRGK